MARSADAPSPPIHGRMGHRLPSAPKPRRPGLSRSDPLNACLRCAGSLRILCGVFGARSLWRCSEGLEFEIDSGPGELMRNAGGAVLHASRAEHPQHVGTKLFHEFAVARAEF